MDEVASWSVGAEAHAVVGAAEVRFILGVAVDVANLVDAVSKLALVAVLASAMLLEGSAHFCLVATGLLAAGLADLAARGDRGANRARGVGGCLTCASTPTNWALSVSERVSLLAAG